MSKDGLVTIKRKISTGALITYRVKPDTAKKWIADGKARLIDVEDATDKKLLSTGVEAPKKTVERKPRKPPAQELQEWCDSYKSRQRS